MPLEVTMANCMKPGDTAEATAISSKGAKLAFTASYRDNNFVPDFTYIEGSANPTGTFTWRWLLRPDTPPGDALLTAVAAKDGKGASFDHPFRVARTC